MGTNRAAIVSLVEATKDKELQRIANKIMNQERILFDEGVSDLNRSISCFVVFSYF